MRFGPGDHELSMKRLGWEPRVGDLVWAHWSNRDVNVTWRSIDTLYPRLAS